MKLSLFVFLIIIIVVTGFGNNNGNNNYRREQITRAEKITRPLSIPKAPFVSKTLDKFGVNHQAVRVTTNQNNKYIISNNPKNGIHVTDTQPSHKWTHQKEIPVNGHKTVGNTLTHANGVGNGATSYTTSGTCIGTTKNVENYLTNGVSNPIKIAKDAVIDLVNSRSK